MLLNYLHNYIIIYYKLSFLNYYGIILISIYICVIFIERYIAMKKPSDSTTDQKFLDTALRQIIHDTDDYIFVKDTALVYQTASEKVAKMIGLPSATEVIGKTDYDIFPHELAEKYRHDDTYVMESGQAITAMVEQLPNKNGTERWTRTWKHAIYDEHQQVQGMYGISRDITHEIDLKAAVASAQKFSGLINNIPCGIAILHVQDQKVYLDYANEGWFRAHCVGSEISASLIGTDVLNTVFEPDRQIILKEYAQLVENQKDEGNATYRLRKNAGPIHWVNVRFCPAYVENNIQYFYAVAANLDERKATEEKLADSQHALREAIENSNIQFFTCFPQQRRCEIYMVNSRLQELPMIWENFPDDFLAYTKVSPEDDQNYRKALQQIIEGNDEAECTVHLAYKNIWTWEKIKFKAIYDANKQLIKIQGYSVNVTRRKNAADRIRKERVRQKSLEDNVFEAFSFNLTQNSQADLITSDKAMLHLAITDTLYKEAVSIAPSLAHTNPATRDVLLRAASRIPDSKDRELFISSCSGSNIRKACSENGGYRAEIQYRRYVGNVIHWVNTTAEVLPDPDSGDLITFFYTKDINTSILHEKLFLKLSTTNYDTISLYDLQDGKITIKTTCNEQNKNLDGIPYTETVERAVSHLADTEDADSVRQQFSPEALRSALATNDVLTVYFSLKTRNHALTGQPQKRIKTDIFYLDEHQDIIVFLLSDVTEIFEQERDNREKLSAALAAAELASVAKTEFLSRMSHEIRTPMNAIIGLNAIALQEKNLSLTMEDHLQKIGISARFLLSLINDILDMSRIESGRMLLKNESFDFEELIHGINTILYEQCRANGLDYDCVLKSAIELTYVGDVIKLQQVLVNILGNAVKFTPKGGKIHFMIEQLEHTNDNAKLRFEISDTGIGIDEGFLPHMFEPFTQEERGRTSTYNGTGLGLAISKKIVDLMGGEITVHSIKNVGSEFIIEIPLQLSPEAKWRRSQFPHNLQPLYTLIVDDDVIVCRHTQLVLQEAGLHTEWVDSGKGAVAKVTAQHSNQHDYDLILLDWKMPDMDGIETASEIRKIVGPNITIIIMTAYDWANIEMKARAAGVDMFMRKPVFANAIQEAFENALLNKKEAPHLQSLDSEYDFTGKRVLLVEDNDINAEIAQSILEMKHCEVELANNGAEAVESFASAPLGYYDAILMDVRMPIMDGLEATRTIRAMRKASSKTIPIIAMTANAFQEDVNLSLESGMNAHLAKPIEPSTLYASLNKFFQKSK